MAARLRLVRPAAARARRAAVDDGHEARGAAPPRRPASPTATGSAACSPASSTPTPTGSACARSTSATGEPQQIVCGASNFEAGATVAVALPGAVLPDGTELRVAKLRGLESHGMMLSERELELGQEHDGIMLLPGDWPVGDALLDHLADRRRRARVRDHLQPARLPERVRHRPRGVGGARHRPRRRGPAPSPRRRATARRTTTSRRASTRPRCARAGRRASSPTSRWARRPRGSRPASRRPGCGRSRTWSTSRTTSCSRSASRPTPSTSTRSPAGRSSCAGPRPASR